jgi:hypothetical protein
MPSALLSPESLASYGASRTGIFHLTQSRRAMIVSSRGSRAGSTRSDAALPSSNFDGASGILGEHHTNRGVVLPALADNPAEATAAAALPGSNPSPLGRIGGRIAWLRGALLLHQIGVCW